MKLISLRTKAGLLATIACVGMTTPAQAVVTWVVSEDIFGVTMVTEGSLTRSLSPVGPVATISDTRSGGGVSETITGSTNGTYYGRMEGQATPLSTRGSFSGHPSGLGSFAHQDDYLVWGSEDGTSPSSLTPLVAVYFPGKTVLSIFGATLDNGPVTVWTHNVTNDTIQVALADPVPEPSGVSLLVVGAVGLMMKRKRG